MKLYSFLLATIVFFNISSAVWAATPRMENYYVNEQTLENVVEDISIATRVPIIITEPSGIKVRNWKASGNAAELVAQLSQNYGLIYNFNGAQYELVLARSAITTTIPLEGVTKETAMRIISRLYPRYSVTSVQHIKSSSVDMIILRGSRKFNEVVDQAIKACGQNCGKVKIIRGLSH